LHGEGPEDDEPAVATVRWLHIATTALRRGRRGVTILGHLFAALGHGHSVPLPLLGSTDAPAPGRIQTGSGTGLSTAAKLVRFGDQRTRRDAGHGQQVLVVVLLQLGDVVLQQAGVQGPRAALRVQAKGGGSSHGRGVG